MMSSVDAELESGIQYVDVIALRWLPLTSVELPDAARLDEENLRVLSAVAKLEERGALIEDPTPQDIEIARLHVKLDLVIELLAGLSRDSTLVIKPVSILMTPGSLAWQPLSPLAPDSEGLLELYLHRAVLEPLRVRARISKMAEGTAHAIFNPMSEACGEALSRHVFLHHRREIAVKRAQIRQSNLQ